MHIICIHKCKRKKNFSKKVQICTRNLQSLTRSQVGKRKQKKKVCHHISTYSFYYILQLIFRKVSDVLKEQELAERRKNDPVLNHTQDHLVRKLFNKFKKGPDVPSGGVVGPDKTAPMPSLPPPTNANNRDIEKGTSATSETAAAAGVNSMLSKAATGNNTAASDGVTPLETISVPAMAVPKKPSGLKGWGRLKVSIILYVTYLCNM